MHEDAQIEPKHVGHDLNDGKIRTSDVLLPDRVLFKSMLLKEQVQKGLQNNGFRYLSPIQRKALPLTITGCSVMAHAKSGTGKTLLFTISALYNAILLPKKRLHTLILVPTREIALQIVDVIRKIGCDIAGLVAESFIGGTNVQADAIKLSECQIAVGTPGRIKHLIETGNLKTNRVKLLVLDEIDELFNESNFEKIVLDIISSLPESKQVIACTATFTGKLDKILRDICPDFIYVAANDDNTPTKTAEREKQPSNILVGLQQFIALLPRDGNVQDTMRKRFKLLNLLKHSSYNQCFIFVNYITTAKSVCNYLKQNDLAAVCITGSLPQEVRTKIFNNAKLNTSRIIVSTDLTARGIDCYNANLVINVGVPDPPILYIHRIGRAGRFGSSGTAVTILDGEEELELFKDTVSSVITEPVKFFLLPADKNTLDTDGCTTLVCDPKPGLIVESLEKYFKENCLNNNKNNQHHNAPKNKTKKKKTKKKKQTVDDVKSNVSTNELQNLKSETVEEKNCISTPDTVVGNADSAKLKEDSKEKRENNLEEFKSFVSSVATISTYSEKFHEQFDRFLFNNTNNDHLVIDYSDLSSTCADNLEGIELPAITKEEFLESTDVYNEAVVVGEKIVRCMESVKEKMAELSNFSDVPIDDIFKTNPADDERTFLDVTKNLINILKEGQKEVEDTSLANGPTDMEDSTKRHGQICAETKNELSTDTKEVVDSRSDEAEEDTEKLGIPQNVAGSKTRQKKTRPKLKGKSTDSIPIFSQRLKHDSGEEEWSEDSENNYTSIAFALRRLATIDNSSNSKNGATGRRSKRHVPEVSSSAGTKYEETPCPYPYNAWEDIIPTTDSLVPDSHEPINDIIFTQEEEKEEEKEEQTQYPEPVPEVNRNDDHNNNYGNIDNYFKWYHMWNSQINYINAHAKLLSNLLQPGNDR